MRRTLLAAVTLSARCLVRQVVPRCNRRMGARLSHASGGGGASRADVLDALRSVDSEALLAEVSRRGLGAEDGGGEGNPGRGSKRPRQEHVVGELRPRDEGSDAREAELRSALATVGVAWADLCGGPPLKAYHSYVRPREGGGSQSAANAAHQIAFLQRHELARRDEHFRNTDLAAAKRAAEGKAPHRVHVVLDNVRSAENVGSIFRSADCGRCLEVVTCGFTPNPLSTAKLHKTAFGAETAVAFRHFDATADALRALRAEGVRIWALETIDGAVPYADAPLPSGGPPGTTGAGGVALVLGNEVTGVDAALLPLVDDVVEIPTFGTKNSMNVACAATVVIFDVLRRWQASS